MQITFDPIALTDEERKVLLAILEVDSDAAPAAKPAPAKAAPAKAAKPAPAPVPEAEPEEEPEEDLLGGGVTREDAVAAASKLVSENRAPEVKAALEKVGAKRVSEVPEAKLADFVKLLG